jgi:3-deoxy-manno-octulosonate cytidylyltransferase (CMP-KDO synthetase)
MKVIGVIPARLAATRLPNKPLLDIAGKPMIQWVWERASQARTLHELYIATPDPEIVAAAHKPSAHRRCSPATRTAQAPTA